MLVTAPLRALGCDQVDGIAGLHHHFNALQLVDAHQGFLQALHNQLRKASFALFMKVVERAIALRIGPDEDCIPRFQTGVVAGW